MKSLNLLVAFLLELCMLAALAFWGSQATTSTVLNIVLAIGAPLIAIVIWALWLAPNSKTHLSGWRYSLVKAVLFSITAILLASTGRSDLALIFVVVALISETVAIIWKQSPQPSTP